MTHSYEKYSRFYVSIDCIVFGFSEGRLKMLVQNRPYEPAIGELSLIGGFVGSDESLDDSAKRILKEFTGLDNVYMQQVKAFGDVERDPGERVISVVYYALINVEDYDCSSSEIHNAKWYDIESLPKLCFDHNQMVTLARQEICRRLRTEQIGGNLLPKMFTLSRLQSLYEAILGEKIDKRNFRRTIIDKNLIRKTGIIDKESSRRGAELYEFYLPDDAEKEL